MIQQSQQVMSYIADSVCKIIRDAEANFKHRFDVILSSLDLWVERDIASAIDYQDLLISIEPMRAYFPENVKIDTVESLTNFILFRRLKNFIELNTKCDEFPKLKLVANKVHNIANIITFIPLLEDLYPEIFCIT
jgi:hypothetical protein